jgi:putative PIN family toxin of toxin-antitoxin system
VRAIVDTNVLVSGLLWHGAPHRLIEQIRAGAVTLTCSNTGLAELDHVIRRSKFRGIIAKTDMSADQIMAEIRSLADIVDPPPLPSPASRDPDDDALLALAVACRADLIVTGDADLLSLGS